MGKDAVKYLALALSISVLAQGPSAMASPLGTATASTAERQDANTAEEQNVNTVETGAGENSDRTDIVQVTMPVVEEDVFDFIMDPQGLIEKTDAAAYGGKRFEVGATLFFRRSDDEAEHDYSSASDALTILNRGDNDVTVTLKASINPESISGITLSDEPEFLDNTEASLYLALTDGKNTVPINSEDGAVIEENIFGVSEGEDPNEYSFQLIGAVNKEGDWSQVTDVVPEVTVTWMVSMDQTEELEEEELEIEEEIEAGEGSAGAGESAAPAGSDSAGNTGSVEESAAPAESNPAESSAGAEESTASAESSPAGDPSGTERSTLPAESGSADSNPAENPGGSAENAGPMETNPAESSPAENKPEEESSGGTQENNGSTEQGAPGESGTTDGNDAAKNEESSTSGGNAGKNEGTASGETEGKNESSDVNGSGGNESGTSSGNAGQNGIE